ncbi:MAG: peptidylprolyl isomerase [Oscillospiraceae bacterium]|nr:peptidylprolyl isomerase [Oscillospiraceae bacterium]
MKKVYFALLLASLMLLYGCGKEAAQETKADQRSWFHGVSEEATEPATEPAVVPTVPMDGDPKDVTCKGSYSAELTDAVIATVGDAELTNEHLQVWYWAEVAQWQREHPEEGPDFHQSLDTQPCEIDSSVNSWQQYFLRQALNRWHTAQAMVTESKTLPLPTEEAYRPNLKNHEKYLTDQPATKYLYGYNAYYSPNTLHQAYLDALPDTLAALAEEAGYANVSAMAKEAFGTTEAGLLDYADTLNRGYMYFTHMSYYIEPTAEELAVWYEDHSGAFSSQEQLVDIRHMLLVPQNVILEENVWRPADAEPVIIETVEIREDGTVKCSENAWQICEEDAEEMLAKWKKDVRSSEATFADLANKNSADTGTALDGGGYQGIRKGQLMEALDAWCFDPARQSGDTTIIRSEYGLHVLYFSRSYCAGEAMAEDAYYQEQQLALLENARQTYPMEVEYSAITLAEAEAAVAAGDILYPDIAHERFPEVPLYLQQDYEGTMYGGYRIVTNGCGITSMAMLASYMADDELTPPEMCARYGHYSHSNGTDGMMFNYEPAVMGFYLREKTYDAKVAKAALEEGQIVISLQHPGYWTRGGHYIVCESIDEDSWVQVRDSNIYNYGKLHTHKEDHHKWGNITPKCAGYWIYEDKVTSIPACCRCGTEETITDILLKEAYTCRKCGPAILRRSSYLLGE